MALLQVEAAVGCRAGAVGADSGLGPNCEGAEMEAEHQTLPAPHPQGTTTPLLPACLRPELHIEGGGVGSCRPRSGERPRWAAVNSARGSERSRHRGTLGE